MLPVSGNYSGWTGAPACLLRSCLLKPAVHSGAWYWPETTVVVSHGYTRHLVVMSSSTISPCASHLAMFPVAMSVSSPVLCEAAAPWRWASLPVFGHTNLCHMAQQGTQLGTWPCSWVAYQISGNSTVCATAYWILGQHQRNHQSSCCWPFVRGIHHCLVYSPHI